MSRTGLPLRGLLLFQDTVLGFPLGCIVAALPFAAAVVIIGYYQTFHPDTPFATYCYVLLVPTIIEGIAFLFWAVKRDRRVLMQALESNRSAVRWVAVNRLARAFSDNLPEWAIEPLLAHLREDKDKDVSDAIRELFGEAGRSFSNSGRRIRRETWDTPDYGRAIVKMVRSNEAHCKLAGAGPYWYRSKGHFCGFGDEMILREWGQEINNRWGFQAMQEAWRWVHTGAGAGAARELEKIWNGIGEWLG